MITSEIEKRPKCPDCLYCQTCSERRCRLCREDVHKENRSMLGTGFTYGQYMEWKRAKLRCQMDLPEYPEHEVREAISTCPADCITWAEVP